MKKKYLTLKKKLQKKPNTPTNNTNKEYTDNPHSHRLYVDFSIHFNIDKSKITLIPH